MDGSSDQFFAESEKPGLGIKRTGASFTVTELPLEPLVGWRLSRASSKPLMPAEAAAKQSTTFFDLILGQ
jgi:hypothetical protein